MADNISEPTKILLEPMLRPRGCTLFLANLNFHIVHYKLFFQMVEKYFPMVESVIQNILRIYLHCLRGILRTVYNVKYCLSLAEMSAARL